MSKYFISSLLILLITFLTLKILDIFLIKYYGLGKPVLYEYSTITGYNIKPSQKLRWLGNEININELGMRSNFEWSNNKKKLKILFFGFIKSSNKLIISIWLLFFSNLFFSQCLMKESFSEPLFIYFRIWRALKDSNLRPSV